MVSINLSIINSCFSQNEMESDLVKAIKQGQTMTRVLA